MDAILFVDDELYFVSRYRDRLELKFKVHFRENPVDSLQFLQEHPEISAVVLDMMMPTPSGVNEQTTNRGLETGIWLLKEARELITTRFLPIMVLTNRDVSTVTEKLQSLRFPDHLVIVCSKAQTPAFYVPAELTELIAVNRAVRNGEARDPGAN